ncbi:hypothetical protein ABT260_003043 [Acinetobacter baumannii]|uniref:hypothetical protein n=2 Tax=Acinetobacter baumannii TaxID=470 RepID=UPI000281850B|nr:hypothetical protein [Acinetobacter baumannii]EKB36536.1 hypothetical protein W9K_01789 [Acinetobacter baumannii Ab33333]EHU1305911.1 hypothetical protein [Acinetobacter baumannii]EHU1428847.1 hypothetical protein [Acinetobacter baumannii]EHU2442264.1 hypothetical protein [Acinetobacter baumannii]EJB5621482.1 hypothetical protein [Acinetobacter baumannii]
MMQKINYSSVKREFINYTDTNFDNFAELKKQTELSSQAKNLAKQTVNKAFDSIVHQKNK